MSVPPKSDRLAEGGADPPHPQDTIDRRALEELYREHHRFVWRSLSRLGVREDRLADACHDVFLVVARRLREFEGRASMRTWLFAIAMRVAQGIRRDGAREQRRRDAVADVRKDESLTNRPHARAEAAHTLNELLESLDDDKRAVFIMAELEGMTAPEIGEALGVKTATIYSRLRMARATLERTVARSRAADRSRR